METLETVKEEVEEKGDKTDAWKRGVGEAHLIKDTVSTWRE